jgi:ribosome-binding factor A
VDRFGTKRGRAVIVARGKGTGDGAGKGGARTSKAQRAGSTSAHAGDEHRRADRVAHEIQRVLSETLIRRSKDPRLEQVAITHVRLTPDLRLARVYFTLLDDRADVKACERALVHATPFLRRGIAAAVALRYVPDLAFSYDSALAGARRVETLLHELRSAATEPSHEASGESETAESAGDQPVVRSGDGEPEGGA